MRLRWVPGYGLLAWATGPVGAKAIPLRSPVKRVDVECAVAREIGEHCGEYVDRLGGRHGAGGHRREVSGAVPKHEAVGQARGRPYVDVHVSIAVQVAHARDLVSRFERTVVFL